MTPMRPGRASATLAHEGPPGPPTDRSREDPVRHTSVASIAVVVAVAFGAACSSPGDGELGGGTTTTAGPERSTTTTADDPEPGGGGGGGEDCAPVWALKAQERDVCEGSTTTVSEPEPELGTGDVQITLRWTSSADLDLHVVEPEGTEISYSDPGPTPTGGQLDVDSNVGCEQEASVENVFWPEGDMPVGDYTVEIHGFSVEGCGGGEYTLVAKVEGETVLDESGSVAEDESDQYTFVVG
jgi:hypothetical protein